MALFHTAFYEKHADMNSVDSLAYVVLKSYNIIIVQMLYKAKLMQ